MKKDRIETNTSSENSKVISYKVVVIGECNVGKSNMIRRLLGYEFEELLPTIAVELGYINIKDIDPEKPNLMLSIEIWDTSGSEKFKSITTTHLRNADGAFIVYDISSKESFFQLDYWHDTLMKFCDQDVVIFLVGNKSDLNDQRQILRKTGNEYSVRQKFHGFEECSAKENVNIKETFVSLCKCISLASNILSALYKTKIPKKSQDVKTNQGIKLIKDQSSVQSGKKCCQ